MTRQMGPYRMKNIIEAVEIDAEWKRLLEWERKFTDVNIGDYFFRGVSGSEDIMSKERFERIFEPCATETTR
ncbi:hypothetical protein [Geobacter sp. SVR]|uniref:hypothetical protein n=1 Tax=Geobacter sp. SVR TaxID=2495594 RepID=UPI00143F0216|nr:hypothetical protein [Geobacter sp. SVR]BCS54096.1 hypothetical protein GSVR_24040 [Geobacter sp. SVR]GCF87579.1 hypothetical protein GSbR_41790 [Geobacter sp. SVR]